MNRSYRPLLSLLLLIGSAGSTSLAQQPEEKSIAYWVSQLGSEQYLRREAANKRLRDAGPAAVAPLIEATRSGDLELLEQAMAVVTAIALSTPPKADGGAWEQLSKVATEASGRRATCAKDAVAEIRNYRSAEARKALAAAGIFVGVDEFAISAISRPVTIVQIDGKWRRDTEALQWLAWLVGVENARVKGAAVSREVLKAVTQLPDLVSLVIIDGEVENNTIIPLIEMDRIEALEFRYVRLSDEQADLIASIPIRKSLSLMGTGVSAAKVEDMEERLPGLDITHRQGGFLGVSCLDGTNQCEISSIVPGSAAEAAGLIRDDVIIGIGETKVTRFKDLQEAVNQHLPGDEVEVRFRRGGEIQSVKLRLRRLEES